MVELAARNLNSDYWPLRDDRNQLVCRRDSGTCEPQQETRARRHFFARVLGSSWSIFVIFGLCSVALVWAISCYNALEDEPYSWNDGISVWPTETLRLLATSLSVFYIWKISNALWLSEK